MASKEPKHFLQHEVAVHNKPDDFWVTYFGKVYDLTPLMKKYEGQSVIAPLLPYGGKDISHMFDSRNGGDIQYHVHPITSVRVPYCPHGPLPDVAGVVPSTRWRPLDGPPWWFDPQYCVGEMTTSRPIRIVNTLTGHSTVLTVCKTDKLSRILERYLGHNAHARSYTWKHDRRLLDMNRTLEENRIPDERDKFIEVGLKDDNYIPGILLYYNDDLTEA